MSQDSSAYVAHHKTLELRCANEASHTIQQFVAASTLSYVNEGDDSKPYACNDTFQALFQQPLRNLRTPEWWEAKAELAAQLCDRATALVSRHVHSVYSRTCGTVEAERVGVEGTSFVVANERVFLHVWRSRREARRLHGALQRLSQVKFEFAVGSPLHVPFGCLVLHQGALVSVLWMPPLLSDTPVVSPEGSLLRQFRARLHAALGIPAPMEVPLYASADARFYLIGTDEVMCHLLVTRSGTDTTNEVRTELITALDKVPLHPAAFIEKEVVAAAAKLLSQKFDAMPENRTIADAVMSRVVPQALHEAGCNVHFLPLVLLSPGFNCQRGGKQQALATQTLLTELVARTMKSLLVATMHGADVPETTAPELQTMQRIILANRVLDRFVKDRAYLHDHVMSVVKVKFALPATLAVSGSSLNLAAILQYLIASLGVEMDGTGKQIARFAAPRVLSTTLCVPPLAFKLTAALDVKAANDLIEATWNRRRAFADPARASATSLAALFSAYMVKSPLHARYFQELESEWPVVPPETRAERDALALTAGLMAETSNTSLQLDVFAERHAASLLARLAQPDAAAAPGAVAMPPCDRPLVVERLRVLAKLVSSSPRRDAAATRYFGAAVTGFHELFALQNSEASSIYFDLLLLQTVNGLRTVGPAGTVSQGSVQRVLDAARRGIDVPHRKSRAAEALFKLVCTAAETAGSADVEPGDASVLVLATAPALQLHLELFPASDCRTAVINYFHLYCLIRSCAPNTGSSSAGERLTEVSDTYDEVEEADTDAAPSANADLHVAAPDATLGAKTRSIREKRKPRSSASAASAAALLASEEWSSKMRQFRMFLAEMAVADASAREALASSDWILVTLGELISFSIRLGQWTAARGVTECARHRYDAADPTGAGKASLEATVAALHSADAAARVIRHYFCRTVRRRWNHRVGAHEQMRRAGIVLMQQVHARTLLQHAESNGRAALDRVRLGYAEACARYNVSVGFFHGCAPALQAFAVASRRRFEEERTAWAVATFARMERLGRLRVVAQHGDELGAFWDVLHMAYRDRVERQERAAFARLWERIETAARTTVYMKEQIARRELLYVAAARVLQRILQSELIQRMVPVLSLYFFAEEQEVRTVLEEECATAVEELRLKQLVFRRGAARAQEDRIRSELRGGRGSKHHRGTRKDSQTGKPARVAAASSPISESPDPTEKMEPSDGRSPDAIRRLWLATKAVGAMQPRRERPVQPVMEAQRSTEVKKRRGLVAEESAPAPPQLASSAPSGAVASSASVAQEVRRLWLATKFASAVSRHGNSLPPLESSLKSPLVPSGTSNDPTPDAAGASENSRRRLPPLRRD